MDVKLGSPHPPIQRDKFGNEVDTRGQTFFPEPKPKRTRRPWVYKEDYDRLRRRYKVLQYIAVIGWGLFMIIILGSCMPTKKQYWSRVLQNELDMVERHNMTCPFHSSIKDK